MYLIQKNNFISTRPQDADYEEIIQEVFLPGDYEFVVFDERTREKGLIAKADPAKLRILYNEETQEDDITSGGIITIFQRATKKGLAKLKRFPDPYIYISRLGFCRRSSNWLDSPSLSIFADLAEEKTFLFYGKIHGHREGIMNTLSQRGIKFQHVRVEIGSEKLAETMIRNKCFAVLAIDGASIGCWRDWETALAGVPCLRITESPEFEFATNPVGHYLTASFADDLSAKVDLLVESVNDGTLLPRLQNAKKKALAITSDPEYYEAMDSLACDWEFLLNRASVDAKRNLLPEFIEKGKTVKTINDPVPFVKYVAPKNPVQNSLPLPEKAYWGSHMEWKDIVIFDDTRTFRRKFFTETEGTWSFDGKILILKWFKWDQEKAELNSNGEFVSALFTLRPFDVEERTVKISNLEGIIVCKNYSDYLATTLPLNKKHFDKLVVVTTEEDKKTQEVCTANSVEFVFSNRFLLNGPFNMGAATNDGFKALSKTDWILRLDADIVLPDSFGETIKKKALNNQCFYGTSRMVCETTEEYNDYIKTKKCKKHETEFAGSGFFQLFKASAWVLKNRPEWYSNSFPSAGGVDLEFRDLWKNYGLVKNLDLPVVHLGRTGVNWGGRTDAVMWKESFNQLLPDNMFEHVFRLFKGKKVAYLPGIGNVGDRLIDAATYQLFIRFGIDYFVCSSEDVTKKRVAADIIAYAGGGNMGASCYLPCKQLRKKALETGIKVVILPQSFMDKEDEPYHAVFVREEKSKTLCKNGILAPDLSLGLRWSTPPEPIHDTAIFLRSDIEGKFKSKANDPAFKAGTANDYLKVASKYKHIITDRLHFAIAGMIAGRDVTLLPNSYHKNKSMYETWLKALGCKWQEQP